MAAHASTRDEGADGGRSQDERVRPCEAMETNTRRWDEWKGNGRRQWSEEQRRTREGQGETSRPGVEKRKNGAGPIRYKDWIRQWRIVVLL